MGPVQQLERPQTTSLLAGKNAHYDTLAGVCVARFNVHIEQIERWRDSQLVGFSATRLRAEALEPELNAAILEIGREDFLLENFDSQSLFSESLHRYYSDDVVLWLGTELTNGKQAAFQRLADVLEPVHTVLEMGVGCVDVFRVVSSLQDSQGDLISAWEAVLGGPILNRGCHLLAHRPCLETTGRHRRTNRGPGVGGPETDLDVENVDADPGGKPHFRRPAQLRAWVEHSQNGP